MIFKKCSICGRVIWQTEDKEEICCGKPMDEIKPNTVDASFEKHIPTYEVKNDKIIVKVNHVMEEKHYIKWIMMEYNGEVSLKEFNPGDEATCEFDYIKGSKLYSYCNLHDLWNSDVE